MSLEERVGRIEDVILVMRDLLVSHDDRLESYFGALERSREEFEFKVNALVDSQIKTEAEVIALKEASRSQLTRIENLENK